MAHGWNCIRFCPGAGTRPRSSSRASRSPSRRSGASRRARRSASEVVLGIDYHHRLIGRGGGELLPEDAAGHPRLPRGADPRRDAGGLRGAAQADRHPLRHRRGVFLQVAVPALHRTRHPPVQPHRPLQCRRLHRGDEGRRLERGALCRPDAAQSAGAGLHRGDRAFRRRGCELLVARMPLLTGRKASRLRFDATSSRSSRKLEGAHYIVSDAPGLGVEVDEERVLRESFRFWEAPHLRRRDGSFTNW